MKCKTGCAIIFRVPIALGKNDLDEVLDKRLTGTGMPTGQEQNPRELNNYMSSSDNGSETDQGICRN